VSQGTGAAHLVCRQHALRYADHVACC